MKFSTVLCILAQSLMIASAPLDKKSTSGSPVFFFPGNKNFYSMTRTESIPVETSISGPPIFFFPGDKNPHQMTIRKPHGKKTLKHSRISKGHHAFIRETPISSSVPTQ